VKDRCPSYLLTKNLQVLSVLRLRHVFLKKSPNFTYKISKKKSNLKYSLKLKIKKILLKNIIKKSQIFLPFFCFQFIFSKNHISVLDTLELVIWKAIVLLSFDILWLSCRHTSMMSNIILTNLLLIFTATLSESCRSSRQPAGATAITGSTATAATAIYCTTAIGR
jgi:hypothetical protein